MITSYGGATALSHKAGSARLIGEDLTPGQAVQMGALRGGAL